MIMQRMGAVTPPPVVAETAPPPPGEAGSVDDLLVPSLPPEELPEILPGQPVEPEPPVPVKPCAVPPCR